MASGDPVVHIDTIMPPATLFAVFGIRAGASTPAEQIPIYSFDAAADWYLDFYGRLVGYGGGGLTFTGTWMAATATTGGCCGRSPCAVFKMMPKTSMWRRPMTTTKSAMPVPVPAAKSPRLPLRLRTAPIWIIWPRARTLFSVCAGAAVIIPPARGTTWPVLPSCARYWALRPKASMAFIARTLLWPYAPMP